MAETFNLSEAQVVKQPAVTGFALPRSVENSDLDWENSVGFPLTKDRMIVFAPAAGLMDGKGDPSSILENPMMAGVIITDQNKVLVMESEPTGGDNFGWTAYLYRERKERKAFLVGEGTMITQKDGSATFESSVRTVYDEIPGSPGCTTKGKVGGSLPTPGGGMGGGSITFEIEVTIS